MEFIHFINRSTLDNIKKNGIQVENHSQGLGILTYPLIKIDFKAPNEEFIQEEKELSSKLSIEES